jgi:hypothetical protein
MKMLRAAVIAPIRFYQGWISPMLGAHCRFLPSCSEYAIMAIEEWGLARGLGLAAWRVVRCHPLCEGGLDLPPRRHPDAPRATRS